MTPLKDRWKAFGITIFDPWIIILAISSVSLSIVLIRQSDVVNIAVYTLLVALSSGVLGGILAKRWDDITEEKVIVTRAKSANRSLQLLLSNVIALEKRARLYNQRHNDLEHKEQVTSEVIKTYLEEVVEGCLSLEEQVIKSIEDWTDIDPTLEIKTVLGLIGELNGNYSNALAQLGQVNSALQETKDKKDKSETEINKLKEEKSQIQKDLARIQSELQARSRQVGIPAIGGSLITGSGGPITFPSTSDSSESRFLVYDSDAFSLQNFSRLTEGITIVDEIEPKKEDKSAPQKRAKQTKQLPTDK